VRLAIGLVGAVNAGGGHRDQPEVGQPRQGGGIEHPLIVDGDRCPGQPFYGLLGARVLVLDHGVREEHKEVWGDNCGGAHTTGSETGVPLLGRRMPQTFSCSPDACDAARQPPGCVPFGAAYGAAHADSDVNCACNQRRKATTLGKAPLSRG
jgi:hypothetical protein